MDKRTNPKQEPVDQNPTEPPRPTITSWEELADRIAAGHRISLTCTRNGEVIKTFEFNDGTKPETPPQCPAPIVEDAYQEPSTEAKVRVADKVASIARNFGEFMRSLTFGKVIFFLLTASFFIVFVLFWLLPMLAVVVPFLLGLTVVVYAFDCACRMVPDFPGKELFVMCLFMLIFWHIYYFFMRGG